jgi:DNA-binding transcriptional MerR regulator
VAIRLEPGGWCDGGETKAVAKALTLTRCEGVSNVFVMLSIGEFARLGQVSPRMLRHYDELGLLRPDRVDPQSGYRLYSVGQLGRLHRLLALRDLGFTLEQIGELLHSEDLPVEHLRGMLQLRRAQIEQHVADDQARLRRVEAHLRALEGSVLMLSIDVVVKRTDPVHTAEASGLSPGFGENLKPVFERLVPRVLQHLAKADARPGIMVAWYEEPADDGSVVLHAGFDVGNQPVPEGDGIRVTELPSITVASVVHRGSMDGVESTYEALVRWIGARGYKLAGRSRELYHEWDDSQPERIVTELQMPIAS